MSMKICKQIGCFLPKYRAHAVLVADARDRVAEAAEDSSLFDGLQKYVEAALAQRPGLTMVDRVVLNGVAKRLVASHENGTLDAWQLVQDVISHDHHEGFLFCDNESERRLNSRIDFLEQSNNPDDWCFKVQVLNVPAHSWGGYRPVGSISPELAMHLEEGVRLPQGMAAQMIRMLESVAHPPEIRRQRAVETFNRYFRPEVDPLCSILAQKLGLIKDGVSIQEFEDMLLPSILTTWL